MQMNPRNVKTTQVSAAASARRRRVVVSVVAVVLVLGLSYGAWAMWRSHGKQKLLASIKDDPRKMRDAVEQGQISREEAGELRWEMMEARMDKTMGEYFALPPAQREKFLDKMIDDMQARGREWQRRAASQPSTRPERDRGGDRPTTGPSEERRRQMAARGDSTPPEKRAQRAEFRAAMMARMQARGMTPGRGGWGGGGGPGRRGGPGR